MPLIKLIFNRKSHICLMGGVREPKAILNYGKQLFDNANLIGYYTNNVITCDNCKSHLASVVNFNNRICLKCFEETLELNILNINTLPIFEIHFFDKLTRKTPKERYTHEDVCETNTNSRLD